MNWGRAKTILIILFLVTDLMLAGTYFALNYHANTIDPALVDQTVALMGKKAISVDKGMISNKKQKDYHLELNNLTKQGDLLAQRFLGEEYQKDSDTHFSGGNSELDISSGRTLYKNHRTPIYITQEEDPDKIEKRCAKYLKAFGFDKDSYFMYNKSLENGIFSFEIMPRYKEYKIEGVHLKGTADKNGILILVGNWFYVSYAESSPKDMFCNVTSVLLNFMYHEENKGTTINKMDACYYIPSAQKAAESVTPLPVYVVSSERGVSIFDGKDASLVLKAKQK